jgi:hypothetical protein
MSEQQGSRPVALAAAFFVAAGVLEIGLGWTGARPASDFWRLWEALARGGLDIVVALGLSRRLAICRTIALIYCLASVTTYAVVLALALGQAAFRFPPAVVVQSLFEVPSCSLLFLYLRSPQASAIFTRPLL